MRVELWGRHIEHPTITGCAQEGLVDTGRPSCCNDPDEHKAACPLLLFICRSVAIDACQRACFFSENTPKAVAAEIRSALHAIDPNLAASDIQTMGQLESAASARRRFQTSLLTIFAAIALFLALVGLYGVMAYSVGRRTREVGIRMALGAKRSDVMLLMLKKAALLLALGLISGLVASWFATRALQAFLFGVGRHDPITILSVCGLLAACGVIAALIPARRAASIDPMQALRTE